MLDLLKKLDAKTYDIICKRKTHYNVKVLEIKDNFILVENRLGEKALLNLLHISCITPGKDLAFGTIPKNIHF